MSINTVPGNIVADEKGKIIAINATKDKLKEIIDKQLKQKSKQDKKLK